MGDIPVLELLDTMSDLLIGLKASVDNGDDNDAVKEKLKKASEESERVVYDIQEYTERIKERLKSVNIHLKAAKEAISARVKKIFDQFVIVNDTRNMVKVHSKELNDALELLHQSKRLQELCTEIDKALQKLNKLNISLEDVDILKGCLDSWEKAAAISFRKHQENEKRKAMEERQRRKEEERVRKKEEEAERRRKEMEEARLKEEKERKEREEVERKVREQRREERLRREEKEKEQRRREWEEKEQRRREEEEKEQKRLEEEERERKRWEEEEGERKRREEEENERRRKAEEEEKIRRREEEIIEKKKREAEEKERRRLEAEKQRKEMERIRREEEARKRRLNPENWTPITYTRTDNRQEAVDNKSYHKGISCIVTAPDGSFEQENVISKSSDDIDEILDKLSPGDKVASSIVTLTSTRGIIYLETTMRVYVPYVPVSESGDELVVMYSVNNSGQWNKTYPVQATKKLVSSENVKLACLELESFETVQLVVLARQKGEVIVVDTAGTTHQLSYEKKTKLVVERHTFKEQTELFISVRHVTLESTSGIVREDSHAFKEILSTSSLMTIECQRPPSKGLELMRAVKNTVTSTATHQRGKLFSVYRTIDGQWNVAPSEIQDGQNDVTVTLPAHRRIYSYLELEMPTRTSLETVYKAAETVFGLATKTSVCVLIRQRSAKPTDAIVQIVCVDELSRRIQELDEMGYDHGCSRSSTFSLQDGDRLLAQVSGNVGLSDDVPEPKVLAFTALIQTAFVELKFVINNTFLQRDFHHYVGLLTCELQTRLSQANADDGLKIELPVQIPKAKVERPKTQLIYAPVRFPYHLTALTGFLAIKLTSRTGVEWKDVMKILDTDKKIKQLERRARNKCGVGEETNVCRKVLLDWMKEQPKHVDKVPQLMAALDQCHLNDLQIECSTFVNYLKTSLTDTALRNLGKGIDGSVAEIGEVLGFEPKKIDDIIKPVNGGKGDQIFQLLAEWRETIQAVELGLNALKRLESSLMKFKR